MNKLTLLLLILFVLTGCGPVAAKTSPPSIPSAGSSSANAGFTFSVGADNPLTYPKSLTDLADEHTTLIPPPPGADTYLLFAASGVSGVPTGAGVTVLQTNDMHNLTFAQGYTSPVMSPPMPFTKCKPAYDPEFDLNYAAPGTVMQDPTLPAGNLIMIYEAENHCPGAVWQQPFYVTVGFARSSDGGKTWPQPVDSELGGPQRYPILKGSVPEPATPENPPVPLGDSLPSAYVDGNTLYVTYTVSAAGGDGMIRVARARLGGTGPLSFSKWYQGAFTQPGIAGLDTGVLPAKGCQGYQVMAQISFDDALRSYMMTFVCVSVQRNQTGAFQPTQGAWYFSTATSLDRQDWTAPQLIANSTYPVVKACSAAGTGSSFDGWYPSFMSPGAAPGHISSSGTVFFMNGCDTGHRTFLSRSFTITGTAP